jgi:hypothetical protein
MHGRSPGTPRVPQHPSVLCRTGGSLSGPDHPRGQDWGCRGIYPFARAGRVVVDELIGLGKVDRSFDPKYGVAAGMIAHQHVYSLWPRGGGISGGQDRIAIISRVAPFVHSSQVFDHENRVRKSTISIRCDGPSEKPGDHIESRARGDRRAKANADLFGHLPPLTWKRPSPSRVAKQDRPQHSFLKR